MMKRKIQALAISVACLQALAPSAAIAAACCAGQAAFPSLLTGYETKRVHISLTESLVIGDAPSAGLPVFRHADDRAHSSLLQLGAAMKLGERFQVGASGPLSLSAQQVGDVTLTSAWEAKTDSGETELASQVFLFSQLDLPTGRSIYEATNDSKQDVTGAGFYRGRLGAATLATLGKWDMQAFARASYGFARTFESSSRSRISPGWGGDVSLGGGYSLSSEWRFGGSVQATFNEAKLIESAFQTETASSSLVWPVQLQATWFPDGNSTVTASYADETLIGPVRNTTLSRSATLAFSYRL